MRCVQVHQARHALPLDRADIYERGAHPFRGRDHLLADEHLARTRVLGDARRDVHRLPVVVALLEEDGAGVQADVSRWEALACHTAGRGTWT